jgi:anti-sigma factor RsiW
MAGAFPQRDGRCDRAHQWSSLRLDGELSELEVALLEKHLETCAACRSFDIRLRSATDFLRAAPAEAPTAVFEIPTQRHHRLPLVRVVAIAAVVAAAALGSLVGSTLNRPAPQREQPVTQVSLLTRDRDQLRSLPRNHRVAPTEPARERRGPPEGII